MLAFNTHNSTSPITFITALVNMYLSYHRPLLFGKITCLIPEPILGKIIFLFSDFVKIKQFIAVRIRSKINYPSCSHTIHFHLFLPTYVIKFCNASNYFKSYLVHRAQQNKKRAIKDKRKKRKKCKKNCVPRAFTIKSDPSLMSSCSSSAA